jgi:hypothetical protein
MRHEPGYYHLLPYMVLYFFFNGLFLPEGLLYTTLLSPLMLYFIYKERAIVPSPAWLLLLAIPLPFQWFHGVEARSFAVSGTLVLTAVLFLFAAAASLKKYHRALPELFRPILAINAVLCALALLVLPFRPIREWMWYSIPLTAGIDALPRLKLFTYEPSYYALIMMPVFLYFLFRVLFGKEKHGLLIALACVVPLLLSLSFGVIGAALIAVLFTLVIFRKRLPVLFRRVCGYSAIILVFAGLLLALTWSGNPVFLRIENIAAGKDTSAMGRLVYSFMFARELAFQHNWLFGIGPGQIKILAHDLIVNHYRYHGDVAEIVRIPNAMAELLATFGVYGFAVKLILEAWLFIKQKIYANVFAFTLFMFVFIYQFTGSFIVNVAELGAWALIFCTRFPEFELPGMQRKEMLP